MPASGASTTRFGMRTGPMWKGSVRAGGMLGMRVAALSLGGAPLGRSRVSRRRSGAPLRRVPLMQQLQPPQRQQVVHLVDRLRERDDVAGEAAGRDRLGLLAELRPQP